MSDISIPGLSDRFNSREIVSQLMELERKPLTQIEDEVTSLKNQRSAIISLNQKLSTVKDSAKALFGFRNPFDENQARSEFPNVLSAVANRDANPSTNILKVISRASSDKYASSSLPLDYNAPSGNYVFKVGDERISIQFPGGTLSDISNAINLNTENLIQSNIIRNTPESQIFTLESLKTGSVNHLSFEGTAFNFTKSIGMIKPENQDAIKFDLSSSYPTGLSTEQSSDKEKILIIPPGEKLKFSIPPTTITDDHEITYEYKTNLIPEKEIDNTPLPGPSLSKTGTITFENISITNAKSIIIIPEKPPEEPKERVDDLFIFSLEGGSATTLLQPIVDDSNFREHSEKIKGLTQVSSLIVENKNTHRSIELSNVQIIDSTKRGDFKPLNTINKASDAILNINGIEIQRPENQINDLIPGVELRVKGVSDQDIEISVAGDDDAINARILELIVGYNQLLTDIDILSRRDESIIESAVFLTDAEQEEAKSKLGILQGDIAIIQLKSALQRIMMNAYPTESGQELALLAQIGIGTDTGRGGTGIDRNRLRGYMNFDESVLDTALLSQRESVKQLFGNDTNGDYIIDSGLAYTIDQLLSTYTRANGILDIRTTTIDGGISRGDRNIERIEEKLTDKEQELKQEFAEMQAAVESLEQSQEALQNFGNQFNNR